MKKIGDVISAFVTFEEGSGGKRRPALVIVADTFHFMTYKITSQYFTKSAHIRSNFFELTDWQEAGLNNKSYVDTGRIIKVERYLNSSPIYRIGTISKKDLHQLLLFLKKTA
ncbi:hypothetical protein NFX39_04520 [Fructobacillus sp. W13]|uniref:Uncharacterized protein n=1 Tax=Fructobacillus apis TaxID=2935017 RepID=A0ABT0ZQU8_9LACO|nr:hypothetical protein [Fructobacillus apis]MCO0832355.1 hypothetical protein [Fructobacillus apis]